jgi:hypothetical protein
MGAPRIGNAVIEGATEQARLQALEHKGPGTQRLAEVELSAHGTLGDAGDFIAQADVIGKFVYALDLDDGRIHVGHQQLLGAPVVGLGDDVDRRVA